MSQMNDVYQTPSHQHHSPIIAFAGTAATTHPFSPHTSLPVSPKHCTHHRIDLSRTSVSDINASMCVPLWSILLVRLLLD